MYYTIPMGIIGKVYANSMLVLINSRMVLGSEETPSTAISVLRFRTALTNPEDRAVETDNRDVGVDTGRAGAGPSGSSEAEGVWII